MSVANVCRHSRLSLSQAYTRASLRLLATEEVARSRCRSSRLYSSHEKAIGKAGENKKYWLYTTVFAFGLAICLTQSPTVHLEAPQQKQLSGDEGASRVDPSTSQSFPLLLPNPITPLPSSCGDLHLIGLGVRTVSFLRVKVYVSALYIDSAALTKLQGIEGWKGYEKSWLLDSKSGRSGEALIASLLDRGITFAIRIVPVRSTDYGHLRDGFNRAIQGRVKLARKKGELDDASDEALSHSLQALKEAFPRASLPKGQAMDLLFIPSRTGQGHDLTLEEGGKVLGQIKAPNGRDESKFSVARQLLLAYLADKDEISKPFKESVAEGFEAILHQGRR